MWPKETLRWNVLAINRSLNLWQRQTGETTKQSKQAEQPKKSD